MDRAILDTDILSELMRGRNAQVAGHAEMYRQKFGRLTISTLSILEVVKGLEKAGREAKIVAFLQFANGHEILTLDAESAETAGRLYARLESMGTTIGRIDPMIAAIAIRHKLVLVTGNTAHYERILAIGFDLQLADWRVE